MTEKPPNHLINESSPYLLQHAYNPVDWYPWNEDALKKAGLENKLLVISIGYAACHWCHVMEHESFEDDEVARSMNNRFVSVKVDREERPDVDHVYMAAAYATTGRGGWPLNVIALPDQRPVFAGTYYSKHDWLYILKYYADLFESRPRELENQANEITAGTKRHFQLPAQDQEDLLNPLLPAELFRVMQVDLDTVNGGNYGAPKFPMPVNLKFIMVFGKLYGNPDALAHVELSLDKMCMGGIYDQLGGGFSRYSVDAHWHVPHFEKMLYDNAQLISLYAQGFTLTKKYEWKSVAEESLGFISRELTSPEGLFYASVDADSEGKEGAFYAWTLEEITRNLGPQSGLFLDYFSCTPQGNWESGWNVLRKSSTDAGFAAGLEMNEDDVSAYINVCRQQLFTVRCNRKRPATDDKILTGWNALMISALTDAYMAFGNPAWLSQAEQTGNFYLHHLQQQKGKLWRNSKGCKLAIPGFLDDYSLLIKAFLDLYQVTLKDDWLLMAESLCGEAMEHFSAKEGIFFNLASNAEPVIVMNSAELSDNVIPASNSVMAHNLFILGHILGREILNERAEIMLKAMLTRVRRNPSFHAHWASLAICFSTGPVTVQIVGDRAAEVRKSFAGTFLPGVIWSGGSNGLAVGLKDRNVPGKTLIYICAGKTCHLPVETVNEALLLLA